MTRDDLLKASASDYMSDAQLEYFKEVVIGLKASTEDKIRQTRDVLNSAKSHADVLDEACSEEIRDIMLIRVNRDTHIMHEAEAALERISSGCYGYCQDTGEPLGIERLLANPLARYLTHVQNKLEEQSDGVHPFRREDVA